MVGSKKRRNAPLLRALTYHLLKRRSELNMKMISDCFFAFNQLSFKNVVSIVIYYALTPWVLILQIYTISLNYFFFLLTTFSGAARRFV